MYGLHCLLFKVHFTATDPVHLRRAAIDKINCRRLRSALLPASLRAVSRGTAFIYYHAARLLSTTFLFSFRRGMPVSHIDRPYKTPTLSCCRRSVIASTARRDSFYTISPRPFFFNPYLLAFTSVRVIYSYISFSHAALSVYYLPCSGVTRNLSLHYTLKVEFEL